MSDLQDPKKIREKLYNEVWSEPMVTVAVRYELSDNGLRKRCKALNIPLPPVGYWAKVRAGKPVGDKPPLPPYKQITLNVDNNNDKSTQEPSKKKTGIIELIDLEELSVDELNILHDFDLLAAGSLTALNNWIKEINVPSKLYQCDDLISKHMSEIEYRKKRDEEHPFTSERIRLWRTFEKVKYRDNEAVIPINVSDKQLNRSYRIVDTILKAFRQLKGNYTVERGEVDNIAITLLGSAISFEVNECKTKRRHLKIPEGAHDLRPLYEETFDGRLEIEWKLHENRYYNNSDKKTAINLSYVDEKNNSIEKQIPNMILEIYKYCCNNEITRELERKKWIQQYEWEKKKAEQKEKAEERRKLEEEKKKQEKDFIEGIPSHADDWFQYERLSKYADELERYLISHFEDEYTVELLREYIILIRKNADKYNPLNNIITEMKKIKSQDY